MYYRLVLSCCYHINSTLKERENETHECLYDKMVKERLTDGMGRKMPQMYSCTYVLFL